MKIKKYSFIISIVVIISLSSLIFQIKLNSTDQNRGLGDQSRIYDINNEEQLHLSSQSNNDLINSIFNSKLLDYYDFGYFPQVYEPSLQATYYALYILNAIGKLNQINQTRILEYIMAHYSPISNRFMDKLAYRYLDTDFSKTYFPLSSVLEVNCYTILSLNILGALSLIDTQEMINFIWSCRNPASGGFIGQSYDSSLDDGFKVATADNTFFAVITLDLLMTDWIGYSTEKDSIISFINRLQFQGAGWQVGGFKNDEDPIVDTIFPFFEPNLLSSYYCIKTLEVFGMESSINIGDFHQFLELHYNTNYFRISEWDYNVNYTNIVATSIGMELSDITNFGALDRDKVVTFILNNRNSLGNWDQSTTVTLHELIDTFQIIRSLENTLEISQLTLNERSQIGDATLNYQSYHGFSLLSEDYTSTDLIHTIVNSFDMYDRLSDLDIQQLYLRIKDLYIDIVDIRISRYFYGYLKEDTQIFWFRSHPIEYYTSGNKIFLNEISQLNSHESTYRALESLDKLFKLDDFATEFDLMNLVNDIIETQFLNDSYYDNFGAFSSIIKYDYFPSEYIVKKIYSDYTYYAIRCLELLSDVLSLNLAEIGLDITALYNYIDRNLVETPSTLYFNPKYSNDIETILKNTYYMIYVLETLNLYSKDSQKIKNYIIANIDHTNIKNIYYSYKISELLNLNIEFDIPLIQELVQNIYSEEFYEFYLTSSRNTIDQEIFLWICDMARNSRIEIEAHYSDTCPLGGTIHLEALLTNLILQDFGTYITFKFESNQVGNYVLSKLLNNTYILDIPIPLDSNYYPTISGYLRAFEGTQEKAEHYVSISTTYNLNYNIDSHNNSTGIWVEIHSSISSNGKNYSLSDGRVFARIYRYNEFIGGGDFKHENFTSYSIFNLDYHTSVEGDYRIEIFLEDGISGSPINIANLPFNVEQEEEEEEEEEQVPESFDDEITNSIPLMIIFIVVPGFVILISSKQLKKSKKRSEFNQT